MPMIRWFASSMPMPVFFRLWVSLAETPMQNISTPQARPRSRPFSLRTRPESTHVLGLAAGGGEVGEEPVGVGHLRDLLRVDEGAQLDDVDPGAEERLDPGDLLLGGDDLLLHLQAVAQADLVDEDLRRAALTGGRPRPASSRRPRRRWPCPSRGSSCVPPMS